MRSVSTWSDKIGLRFLPGIKDLGTVPGLAAHHPDLLERALILERNALTGRHSRFDEVEFGGSWDELVRTADRFPSSSTTVGLGRSFARNQWARVNGVVDDAFHVKRGADERARFRAMANQLRGEDNALDVRSVA